jgi:dTDP-L-rhamnose 4-epimerase
MTKKKVLITGGAGFIGSNLTVKLSQLGYEVTVFDSLSPQIHGSDPNASPLYQNIIDNCHFIKGDVVNKADWEKAIGENEIVIHLAAETGTGQSMYEIGKYVQTNSIGTANLMEILLERTHNVQKVIVASSRAIYGEGKYSCVDCGIIYPKAREINDMIKRDFECKCPICNNSVRLLATDEESKIHPSSVYGITKHNQEELIMQVSNSIGLPCVAFRFQNVYGPGQSLSNPYTGILSIFSKLILEENEINIFEDGEESRDFIYIDDVVDLIILGMEKEEANFHCFNGGTGINTSVKKVTDLLIKNFSKSPQIRVSGAFRSGDIRHNFSDITKTKKILGFKANITLESGISKFSQWVVSQNNTKSSFNYLKSIEELKAKGFFYDK